MSNKWKTTEQMVEDNKKLRARLEAKQPGCTAKVSTPEDYTTLDHIFDEERDLRAVETGLAASSAVNARGADVAARYTAQTTTPNTTENLCIDPQKFRAAIASGKISAKALAQHGEVARLKGTLKGLKPGSTSAKSVEARIAHLQNTMPPLFPEK